MTEPAPPIPHAPPRRRRRRRWLIALLVLLVLLLLLTLGVVLAVRAVLAGDLPRRILVDELRKATGLHVEIGEARVTWGGTTTLRDISLRLPLDPEPLFAAPTLTVTHAPLYAIVLSGDPGLKQATIAGATINITEDERGRWSPLRAVSLITSMLPPSSPGSGPPAIPAVSMTGAIVNISRHSMPPVSLPLTLTGSPESPVVYAFDAALGASRAKGRLSTTGLDHRVDLTLADLDPVLALFVSDAPSPLRLDATWDGDLDTGSPAGVLTIRDLRAGEDTASGRVAISVEDDALVARPLSLSVTSPRLPRAPVTITRGAIRLEGSVVRAQSIRADLPGLAAELSAHWKLDAGTGALSASWAGAEEALSLTHSGHASFTATIPQVGPRVVAGAVDALVQTPTRTLTAESTLELTGPRWSDLRATLDFPTLLLSDPDGAIDLSTAHAELVSEWPGITLAALTLPGAADLVATARFQTDTYLWSLGIDTSAVTIPRAGLPTLSLHLRATGDTTRANFSDLRAVINDLIINASGSHDPARASPLRAHANITKPLPQLAPSADEAQTPLVTSTLEVLGSIQPLALRAEGILTASNLRLGETPLAPLEIQTRADITPEAVAFETDPFPLLAGNTSLSGTVDLATSAVTARLIADAIDLERAAAVIAPGVNVSGALGADLAISLPRPSLDALRAEGDWFIANAAGDLWAVPEGRGKLAIAYPDIHIHDIHLANADASITGELRLDATTPDRLSADITTSRWPLRFPESPLSLLINAHALADIDLAARASKGDLTLDTTASYNDSPLAHLTLDATLDGRTARTTNLRAEVLDGVVTGSATAPIDDWTTIVADLAVTDINLARLAQFVPHAAGLVGTVSGDITARNAPDTTPLAPWRIEANLLNSESSRGPLQLGDIRLLAFAGPERIVIDNSTIGVASGTLSVWSRLSYHDNEPFLHLSLNADRLNIDQIIHAVAPDAPPIAGLLSGPAILGGYLDEPHRAFGDAELTLANADIGRIPVISELYGLLSLDLGAPKPEGKGQLRFRLEGDTLELSRIQYFNRGVDVFGSARIANIWIGDQSPISGSLAAAIRPLRDSAIPLGDQLDRLFTALFDSAVSVRVNGTLAQPATQVVPFADVASGFQRILGTSNP